MVWRSSWMKSCWVRWQGSSRDQPDGYPMVDPWMEYIYIYLVKLARDLTRPIFPKWWFSVGEISINQGTSRFLWNMIIWPYITVPTFILYVFTINIIRNMWSWTYTVYVGIRSFLYTSWRCQRFPNSGSLWRVQLNGSSKVKQLPQTLSTISWPKIRSKSFFRTSKWLGGGFVQDFLEFSPLIWGNDPIWRSHIFQMGWFNHQLGEVLSTTPLSASFCSSCFCCSRWVPWIENNANKSRNSFAEYMWNAVVCCLFFRLPKT